MVMRDAQNAVRYWDPGDIPLPKEVLDYHQEKLEGRAKKEGRPLDFNMVVRRPAVRLDTAQDHELTPGRGVAAE